MCVCGHANWPGSLGGQWQWWAAAAGEGEETEILELMRFQFDFINSISRTRALRVTG